MTILDPATAGSDAHLLDRRFRAAAFRPRAIRVGLVNNMPDSALLATERQFRNLLAKAAIGAIDFHLFYLPAVPRGEEARAHLMSNYRSIDDLYDAPIDALIVTGTEPRAARLDDEPYWADLARLIDWARVNTISTIWSCLAAHAAALHLDGIARRPLRRKRSGVFTVSVRSPELAALPASLAICHSRLNEVSAGDLDANGYAILSISAGRHVDMFAKRVDRSRFFFFQGHPEYEPDSLMREYRRDVLRYLRGERENYPDMPANYFDTATFARMCAFRADAERTRGPALHTRFPQATLRRGLEARLQFSAVSLFRSWLAAVSESEFASAR
jgi:homoserine O-succinyltransferase